MSPAPSLPRKGTETGSWRASSLERSPASRTLLTPQGDGNHRAVSRCRWQSKPSRTLLTPQGDGNLLLASALRALTVPLCPAPSLPRKGTETIGDQSFQYCLFRSRTLLTPQGDGNRLQAACKAAGVSVPHPPYPARGRKQSMIPGYHRHDPGSRTLLTPQGDGNFRIGAGFLTRSRLKSRTLLTPQGDGNVGVGDGYFHGTSWVPHPPYPARGRKLAWRTVR